MRRKILQILVMVLATCPLVALAQAPKDGVYISDEDVKAVLKHSADTKRTIPDNTLRVIDMDKYQLGVAVIHRGSMAASGGNAGAAAATNPAPACGEQRPGATGPSGIFHDDTAESYVVISTILNGPSCGGTMVGYTSREIKTGDIIVIAEGVPHGFSTIPDHITYLSIRPDLKKVLQHGYVNPALKK
jgi:hypothetical protein